MQKKRKRGKKCTCEACPGFYEEEKCKEKKEKWQKRNLPVQLVEVEDGEKDAEEVDQDPDGIQHIVTIWSLHCNVL